MAFRITAPNKDYSATTQVGPVKLLFQNGVALLADGLPFPDGTRRFLESNGYTVEKVTVTTEVVAEPSTEAGKAETEDAKSKDNAPADPKADGKKVEGDKTPTNPKAPAK